MYYSRSSDFGQPFCPQKTAILCGFLATVCVGFLQHTILSEYYLDIISILSRYYRNIIGILSRYYRNIIGDNI